MEHTHRRFTDSDKRIDLPDTTVDTIGGLLIEHFGHIPQVDETLTLGGYDFTVLEVEQVQQVEQVQTGKAAV